MNEIIAYLSSIVLRWGHLEAGLCWCGAEIVTNEDKTIHFKY